MRRRMLLVIAMTVSMLVGFRAESVYADSAGPNLLTNPAFDPPWSKRFDGCKNRVLEEVQVPDGWDPYFVCQQPSDPPNINRTPEFRMISSSNYPDRVHSPPTALRYFNFWALNRSAGVFQVVNGVRPGSRLRFSMWVQLWTSDSDIQPPSSLVQPGNLEARLCIQQAGGQLNLGDASLVCSGWARPWDHYEELSVEGTALGSQVTVALNTRAEFPVKHNDVQADDAALVVIGQGSLPNPGSRTTAVSVQKAHPALLPRAPKPIFSLRNRVLAE
jgi:hypothetical protein